MIEAAHSLKGKKRTDTPRGRGLLGNVLPVSDQLFESLLSRVRSGRSQDRFGCVNLVVNFHILVVNILGAAVFTRPFTQWRGLRMYLFPVISR
jgi:hypothetical protein